MVSTFWTYFQNQDFWWRNVDTTNKNQKYQPKFDQIKIISHQLQKFLYGKFYVWFANLFFFRFVGHKTPAENLGQNFPFGLHNGLARGRAGRARENLFGGLNNASFRLLNLVWNLRISKFVNFNLWICEFQSKIMILDWILLKNNNFERILLIFFAEPALGRPVLGVRTGHRSLCSTPRSRRGT